VDHGAAGAHIMISIDGRLRPVQPLPRKRSSTVVGILCGYYVGKGSLRPATFGQVPGWGAER
jgi:hypothetical protein